MYRCKSLFMEHPVRCGTFLGCWTSRRCAKRKRHVMLLDHNACAARQAVQWIPVHELVTFSCFVLQGRVSIKSMIMRPAGSMDLDLHLRALRMQRAFLYRQGLLPADVAEPPLLVHKG